MHKKYRYLSSQSSEVDVGNKERQNLKKIEQMINVHYGLSELALAVLCRSVY